MTRGIAKLAGVATVAATLALWTTTAAPAASQYRTITPLRTVSVRDMVTGAGQGARVARTAPMHRPEVEPRRSLAAMSKPLAAALGGETAPVSPAVNTPNSSADGFEGMSLLSMSSAGTGQYKGTNGGLEPPDQGLCAGNGFLIEGVNQAYQIFTNRGFPLTPPIPIAQFFKLPPSATVGPSAFLSDPRCFYDAPTRRWFVITLEVDTATAATFTRAHNYIAVSKTSNPTGDWFIYGFDVTDDGTAGTPLHATCPCLGDQPLLGADKYGFYLSTNEYSDAEIVPVQLPPAVNDTVNKIYTLPDFRNGQAQVYAMSKQLLESGGSNVPVVQVDTASTPLPSGAPMGAVWGSLNPAQSPPGDTTAEPAEGAEYFLTSNDFDGSGASTVGVWALTNTASLAGPNPSLSLKQTLINTKSGSYQYLPPDGSHIAADQKAGPIPLGNSCVPSGCKEERLNGNDDRMNEVMLTNGTLWGAVNTVIPPIEPTGSGALHDYRVGIMYFAVQPAVSGGNLSATMVRDGYVKPQLDSAMFPSIGATPGGTVVMGFSLSGYTRYPSTAWARLDDLAPGKAPVIHVSGVGAAPEDGFTGYPVQGIASDPTGGQLSNGVARWGDYSYTAVDEQGCIWTAEEYIPADGRLSGAGNWGTYITRYAPPGCTALPLITPAEQLLLKVNPCGPLFTNPPGSDNYNPTAGLAPISVFRGQNPQMNILKGDIKVSDDGKTLSTILTINDLSKTIPPYGDGNTYYFYWTWDNTTFYTEVQVTSTGITYIDGTQALTRTARSSGPADTGAFNEGKNGTVIVNVPTSVVVNPDPKTRMGPPKKGDLLMAPHAETRELTANTIVLPVDSAGPQYDYLIGLQCTAAKPPVVMPPPVTPSGNQLPNTSTTPAGIAVILITATLAGARRRSLTGWEEA